MSSCWNALPSNLKNACSIDTLNYNILQHWHTGRLTQHITSLLMPIKCPLSVWARVCVDFFLVFFLDLISSFFLVCYISCLEWVPFIYDLCRFMFSTAHNIYQSFACNDSNSSGVEFSYCSYYLLSWSLPLLLFIYLFIYVSHYFYIFI